MNANPSLDEGDSFTLSKAISIVSGNFASFMLVQS